MKEFEDEMMSQVCQFISCSLKVNICTTSSHPHHLSPPIQPQPLLTSHDGPLHLLRSPPPLQLPHQSLPRQKALAPKHLLHGPYASIPARKTVQAALSTRIFTSGLDPRCQVRAVYACGRGSWVCGAMDGLGGGVWEAVCLG